MRYIQIANWNITIKEKPIRNLGNWEVLIKVKFAWLCGSDMHKINDKRFSQDNILWHEIVWEILDASKTELVWKNVVVDPIIPCWNCDYCNRQDTQLCINIKSIWRNMDWWFAEYLIVPENNIHVLSDSFDIRLWTLVDWASVILHWLNLFKKGYKLSDDLKLAIIWDGTIWALSSIIFWEYIKNIDIFTKNNEKYINDIWFNSIKFEDIWKTLNEYYDVVIECVWWNQNATLNEAFRIAKRWWAILTFWVFWVDYFCSLKVRELFYKEILLLWVNSYWYSDWNSDFENAILHIDKNQNKYNKLIINEYKFEDFGVSLKFKNPLKTIYRFI